jgi:hypothetical protein
VEHFGKLGAHGLDRVGDGGLARTGSARKDHESYLDHRMQPDLGVANLSRLSQAPNAAIKKRRLCIRVIGFVRSAGRYNKRARANRAKGEAGGKAQAIGGGSSLWR